MTTSDSDSNILINSETVVANADRVTGYCHLQNYKVLSSAKWIPVEHPKL